LKSVAGGAPCRTGQAPRSGFSAPLTRAHYWDASEWCIPFFYKKKRGPFEPRFLDLEVLEAYLRQTAAIAGSSSSPVYLRVSARPTTM
jgi:hypothetical protein